jgi:hypothetical protein
MFVSRGCRRVYWLVAALNFHAPVQPGDKRWLAGWLTLDP